MSLLTANAIVVHERLQGWSIIETVCTVAGNASADRKPCSRDGRTTMPTLRPGFPRRVAAVLAAACLAVKPRATIFITFFSRFC
jgi:hypothetical protein